MSQPQPHPHHHVRRVVLPSGRSIEVVYFDSQAELPPTRALGYTAPPTQLHLCPECASELVYPTEWEETSPTHWEVARRCPACEWSHVGVYDQATVDHFDDELDRGTEALIRDLKRLVRANMEEEAERFSAALAADAVWPMDF